MTDPAMTPMEKEVKTVCSDLSKALVASSDEGKKRQDPANGYLDRSKTLKAMSRSSRA
jgi:hypothetical protein